MYGVVATLMAVTSAHEEPLTPRPGDWSYLTLGTSVCTSSTSSIGVPVLVVDGVWAERVTGPHPSLNL